MLCRLDISNYALIENVNLNFKSGYSVITGETGAGKSILLKALNLLLGERADYSVLRQNDKKCVLEAEFDIQNIISESFFNENNIDFEPITIIRREFTTSGKSRIFINDTPTNLATLKVLGNRLVKIHTQHQTLELFEKHFQFDVLDSFAEIESIIKDYTSLYSKYKSDKNNLTQLKLKDTENRKEKDYIDFLVKELNDANLDNVNITELENEYLKIQNWSSIKKALESSLSIYQSEQSPITGIDNLLTSLYDLREIDPDFSALILRLNSAKIELQDIESELENKNDLDDLDEEKALAVKEKIEAINALSYKHNVDTIEELITLRNNLAVQMSDFGSIENDIKTLELSIIKNEIKLNKLADKIHSKRQDKVTNLQNEVNKILNQLAMPNAELKIDLKLEIELQSNGKNSINFLFKTNLGGDYLAIKKTASGGELSRLMLAILVIVAKTKSLPTLLFDEIDTGVSGEVASKMANIFEQLGQTSQLISITHLPQIAGKGKVHYHVFKADSENKTQTKVVELSTENRIKELAKMMSGETVTESAIENAKQLLTL